MRACVRACVCVCVCVHVFGFHFRLGLVSRSLRVKRTTEQNIKSQLLVSLHLQLSFLGEKRFENPQTANLNSIMKSCVLVQQCLKDLNKKPGDVGYGEPQESTDSKRRSKVWLWEKKINLRTMSLREHMITKILDLLGFATASLCLE